MDINHPDQETWQSRRADADRERPGVAFDLIERFHVLDHQLLLHVLAGVLITAMLIAVTLTMTSR